jgi:dihydroorotase/N-acyl-D-amino-acid deacylase
VEDLAGEAGKDNFDFLADLAIEEEGSVTFLFGMPPRPWSEKVFTRIQDHPQLSVGADTLWPEVGDPPPSGYGCFPRILGHYVRELGMYTLEEAVWRCTGLSASRFGLDDRGVIGEGAAADLVVFDPEDVADNSSMEEPRVYPSGIENVVVNGKVMVEDSRCEAEDMPGRLLTP